jgi:hypothetical protein
MLLIVRIKSTPKYTAWHNAEFCNVTAVVHVTSNFQTLNWQRVGKLKVFNPVTVLLSYITLVALIPTFPD